jgi:hypothetical protein
MAGNKCVSLQAIKNTVQIINNKKGMLGGGNYFHKMIRQTGLLYRNENIILKRKHMNKYAGHKIFLFFVFLFTLTSENKAQIAEENCLHYPYNTQIGINVNVNLASKIKIEPSSDDVHLSPNFKSDIGIYYVSTSL